MSEKTVDPYALWFLRLTLAIALLAFVVLNVGGLDPAAARYWLGFPADAPMLFVRLEFILAMALIVGIWPRAAALAGAASLLAALVSVRGFAFFSNPGIDWAPAAMWIGALILLSFLGDGAFALLPTASFARKQTRR